MLGCCAKAARVRTVSYTHLEDLAQKMASAGRSTGQWNHLTQSSLPSLGLLFRGIGLLRRSSRLLRLRRSTRFGTGLRCALLRRARLRCTLLRCTWFGCAFSRLRCGMRRTLSPWFACRFSCGMSVLGSWLAFLGRLAHVRFRGRGGFRRVAFSRMRRSWMSLVLAGGVLLGRVFRPGRAFWPLGHTALARRSAWAVSYTHLDVYKRQVV